MGWANYKECAKVGLDPKQVERIATRLDRAMKDAGKLGLSLFCGGSGQTLRYNDGDESGCLLIVGHCTFNNADGGDGGGSEDENGFIRGE